MKSEHDELSGIYQDYFNDSYSDRWSSQNPGNKLIVAERSARVESLLGSAGLLDRPVSVLDLGCGSATALPESLQTELRVGEDLLFERLPTARATGLLTAVACVDGAMLPHKDDTFDLVVLSTVLSSVLHRSTGEDIGREVTRVLKPGGAVLWYDMRYPNPGNRNIRPMTRRQVRLLFPQLSCTVESITVVPQLSRRIGSRPSLYRALAKMKFLNSHLIGLLTKPTANC